MGFISSREDNVLKVSFSDGPMSVVHGITQWCPLVELIKRIKQFTAVYIWIGLSVLISSFSMCKDY